MIKLNKRKRKFCIGIQSGTSVDSVDVVLVRISGTGISTKVEAVAYEEFSISQEIKNYILKVSTESITAGDICKLNFIIAELFSKCIIKFIKKNGLRHSDISFIGSHGQTIWHSPDSKALFGVNTKSTLQLGDISVIANRTNITTIGDFRTADMANGGQGAPLVPYLDYVLFRSTRLSRLLLNIGGISNITYLKKNTSIDKLSAFDTGPGNMLIDALSKKLFYKAFDKDGNTSRKGKFSKRLFESIVRMDNFPKIIPPKSTGREHYNKDFIEKILENAKKFRIYQKPDILRTVTEYTAYTIRKAYDLFLKKNGPSDELIVSGGGAKNLFLLELLKKYFSDMSVKELYYNGINTSNKEAVLFAVLANETMYGNTSNVPSVTGAKSKAILGKISYSV